ncbi:serpentine type 7TM GPCR chemoreceptor srsx domain-containing protein [Ditylenchus destructor]|nr:serpentine type 7TM GPCR chemoreceptor srsx domain-containing protein [Ditylenchus destructor]
MAQQNINEIQSQIYTTYKNQTIIVPFVPAAIVFLIEGTLGIVGNLNIVYATIVNRSLHGSCNILLGIASIADSLNLLSTFIFAGFVFSGRNFVPLPTCFYFYAVPIFGTMVGVETVFIIGLDRLFSVLLPTVYRHINKWAYIGMTMCAAMLYAGLGLYQIYKLAELHPYRMVVPFIGEAEHDFLMTFFINIVIFNVATIGFYVTLWLVLKVRNNLRDNSRRIIKSLVIISMVIFFGWTVCSCVQLLINMIFGIPEIASFFVELYFGVTVHGSLSINFLILYKFSGEYRRVFQIQLNKLSWRMVKRTFLGETSVSAANITVSVAAKQVTSHNTATVTSSRSSKWKTSVEVPIHFISRIK